MRPRQSVDSYRLIVIVKAISTVTVRVEVIGALQQRARMFTAQWYTALRTRSTQHWALARLACVRAEHQLKSCSQVY